MATNKKLDPALAETVERVLEDLMVRFEAAEEQLEFRADLPEISSQTEASLLRAIEADLDVYYPQAFQKPLDASVNASTTAQDVVTWLRITGNSMLERIAELILPSMPTMAAARSHSRTMQELEVTNGVTEKVLRDLSFVPIKIDRDEHGINRLVLRYFGMGPVPHADPMIEVKIDGVQLNVQIESNLPSSPPEIDLTWMGDPVYLDRVGRTASDKILIELTTMARSNH